MIVILCLFWGKEHSNFPVPCDTSHHSTSDVTPDWSGQGHGFSDSPPASILPGDYSEYRTHQSLHQYHGSLLNLHASVPASVRKSLLLGAPSTKGAQEQLDKPARHRLLWGQIWEAFCILSRRAPCGARSSDFNYPLCPILAFVLSSPHVPHSFIPTPWNALPINHSHSSPGPRHYFQGNQTSQSASALIFKKRNIHKLKVSEFRHPHEDAFQSHHLLRAVTRVPRCHWPRLSVRGCSGEARSTSNASAQR